jgi:hypothetical protein
MRTDLSPWEIMTQRSKPSLHDAKIKYLIVKAPA